MQFIFGKRLCQKANCQGRFYLKHNHYATNKPTSHPLQCHKRKSTFHDTGIGNLTSKKRIQRHRVSLLYSTIRRSDKYPSIEPYRRTCKRTQPIFHRSLLRRRIGQGWKDERHPYPEQRTALRQLVNELLLRFPGCKVCGHRDLSPDLNSDGKIEPNEWTKQCPCFDVETEL